MPRLDGRRREDVERDDAVAPTVPEPTPSEYDGPPIDELRASKPDDRSFEYHAVVNAFYDGYAGMLNWRFEGTAAALGERDGLSAEAVVADLRDEGPADRSAGFDRKTPGCAVYDHNRAGRSGEVALRGGSSAFYQRFALRSLTGSGCSAKPFTK